MNQKQAVTREYLSRYQKAAKKAKPALLDEFIRLTGYHRKSAVRLLSRKPAKEIMVYAGGEAVKLKPEGRAFALRANALSKRLALATASRQPQR
ncbi:MAG: hypothetical protein LBJ35_07580 [Spirochaetaceae bacterium]|jgi:hypothetical protein|nr:hypothetical protein [Spirochaetaceae bacterium]